MGRRGSLATLLLAGSLIVPVNSGFANASEFRESIQSRQVSDKKDMTILCIVSGQLGAITGATVSIEGTDVGATTNMEGIATLQRVPIGSTIVIPYIGFIIKKITVKQGVESYSVKLEEDSKNLNEVVVIGYGTQKKANLTGAVDQVSPEVFKDRPTANVTQMLEGVVPNLNISLADDKPGRSSAFNIRGTGSINGGSALVLTDDVEGDLSLLNPGDIENVSVLKDAAASAIYGARAPYGVVLITAKNPQKGTAKTNYSSNYSIRRPIDVPDVISDGYTRAEHFRMAYYNFDSSNPSGINKTQQFSTTWLEEYKRRHDNGNFGIVVSDGSIGTKGRCVYYPEGVDMYDILHKDHVFSQSQNLSISGSDSKFDYYLSGRSFSHDGLFDSKK